MGMNNAPGMPGNLDELKEIILQKFKAEGYSESLEEDLQQWVDKKYEEGRRPGGTIEERIKAQVEVFELSFEIGKDKDQIIKELEDLMTEAEQSSLDLLATEIYEKIVIIYNKQ